MRVLFKEIYCLIAILFGAVSMYAKETPPSPRNFPPPPPGGAIDGELLLLFGVALLFGFYTIYTSRLKNKRSV